MENTDMVFEHNFEIDNVLKPIITRICYNLKRREK